MAVALAATWDQLPLAEAFWLLWAQVLPDDDLDGLYDQHRGRGYRRRFSFSDLVHLVSDALCQHGGRAQPTLTRHGGSPRCPASVPAFYGKLRRLPAGVSHALVAHGAARLRPWRPAAASGPPLPPSLAGMRVLVFDGKTFKGAAKRLAPLRGRPGAAPGGRMLGVLDLATELVVGLTSHPHGHVNEQLLVPAALEQVRGHVPGPRLWVADRQFGNLANLKRCTAGGDHCVLRKHSRTAFRPDAQAPVGTGVDARGRPYRDEVGRLVSSREGEQAARQITVRRAGQADLVILTSLTDAAAYPADDLLELYRRRWDIEQTFQKLSTVFRLSRLIGSHPRAIVFQAAVCVTLANTLTVLRALLAHTQRRAAAAVSVAKVWEDLHRQLTAGAVLATPDELLDAVRQRRAQVVDLRGHLERILAAGWTDRWIKSPPKRRHLPKVKHRRGGRAHFSIHAVLELARQRPKKHV